MATLASAATDRPGEIVDHSAPATGLAADDADLTRWDDDGGSPCGRIWPAKQTDPRDVIHPREAADAVEAACLHARLKAGVAHRSATIVLAATDAMVIAKLLRLVPLKKGNQPQTTRERRSFSILVDKAHDRKRELMAEARAAGKRIQAKQAEEAAAKWACRGTGYRLDTIARAMHRAVGDFK